MGGHRALAIHFHERHALVDPDQQAGGTFATGQQQLLATGLVQAYPGAEGERPTGVVLQRRAGRQQQRLAAELQGTADDALDGRASGVLRGVAVGGGVLGGRAIAAIEMVDGGVAGIESQLAVGSTWAFWLP